MRKPFVFNLVSLDCCFSQFANSALIDEYRIMVNPIVLGKGTPLFKGFDVRLYLKLLKAKTFRNGNVLLFCQPPIGYAEPDYP